MIDKVAWLEVVDGRILSTRSKGKDVYYLPGGKREAGETDLETLVREIKEELTVSLDPATVRYFGTFQAAAHGQAAGATVQLTCYQAGCTGTPTAGNEIAEVRWLTYADRPQVSPVDQLIFDYLHNAGRLQ